jgi:putative ABC transport system substrate-binding protein
MNKFKQVILMLLVVGIVAGCGSDSQPVPVIGLISFAPDPSTDRTVRGVKDGLKEAGYEDGENIRLEYNDAQGDFSTIQTIAQKYVADKVDIIVPMTTPCLMATANVVQGTDRIIVFAEVYDPYAASVAVSPTEHPPNLVGVASPPPVAPILDLIAQLMPEARRIGIIYNPAEANAVSVVERIRARTAERGMALVERMVAGSSEVQQAAQSMVGKIDAFFITGDNTVQVSFDAVVGTAEAGSIPVFVNDSAWVERGAVVGMGPDFYEAGRAAAKIIAQILEGADPAEMEIQQLDVQRTIVNLDAAQRQGIVLPQELIEQAAEVIQ